MYLPAPVAACSWLSFLCKPHVLTRNVHVVPQVLSWTGRAGAVRLRRPGTRVHRNRFVILAEHKGDQHCCFCTQLTASTARMHMCVLFACCVGTCVAAAVACACLVGLGVGGLHSLEPAPHAGFEDVVDVSLTHGRRQRPLPSRVSSHAKLWKGVAGGPTRGSTARRRAPAQLLKPDTSPVAMPPAKHGAHRCCPAAVHTYVTACLRILHVYFLFLCLQMHVFLLNSCCVGAPRIRSLNWGRIRWGTARVNTPQQTTPNSGPIRIQFRPNSGT